MATKQKEKASKIKGAALVTGGAIRIGKAISIVLAKDGYDIALHYNSSEKEAIKTAGEIKKLGRKCEIFKCDLNRTENIKPLIKKAKSKFNNLNLLINSASIFEQYDFMATTEDIYDRHMNINLKAPFFLTQEFARICKKGQVVNILDTYITRSLKNYFVYLLTKKSLYDLTRISARALGPHIRVNALAIGINELSTGLSDDFITRKIDLLPLGRIINLDDITDTLINLINMKSVTGQCIFIDGGEELI